MMSRRLVQFSTVLKTFATKYKLTINFCSIYSLNPSLAATYLSYPRDQVKLSTNIQIGIQMGNITVDAGVIRCTPLHKLWPKLEHIVARKWTEWVKINVNIFSNDIYSLTVNLNLIIETFFIQLTTKCMAFFIRRRNKNLGVNVYVTILRNSKK